MIRTKHTLSSLSHIHTQRQSPIRWTVEAEIKKNKCRNSIRNAGRRAQVTSFVSKLAGCTGHSAIETLPLLSSAYWRDNPGLLCLFVLLHTITPWNDNVLITPNLEIDCAVVSVYYLWQSSPVVLWFEAFCSNISFSHSPLSPGLLKANEVRKCSPLGIIHFPNIT